MVWKSNYGSECRRAQLFSQLRRFGGELLHDHKFTTTFSGACGQRATDYV